MAQKEELTAQTSCRPYVLATVMTSLMKVTGHIQRYRGILRRGRAQKTGKEEDGVSGQGVQLRKHS